MKKKISMILAGAALVTTPFLLTDTGKDVLESTGHLFSASVSTNHEPIYVVVSGKGYKTGNRWSIESSLMKLGREIETNSMVDLWCDDHKTTIAYAFMPTKEAPKDGYNFAFVSGQPTRTTHETPWAYRRKCDYSEYIVPKGFSGHMNHKDANFKADTWRSMGEDLVKNYRSRPETDSMIECMLFGSVTNKVIGRFTLKPNECNATSFLRELEESVRNIGTYKDSKNQYSFIKDHILIYVDPAKSKLIEIPVTMKNPESEAVSINCESSQFIDNTIANVTQATENVDFKILSPTVKFPPGMTRNSVKLKVLCKASELPKSTKIVLDNGRSSVNVTFMRRGI